MDCAEYALKYHPDSFFVQSVRKKTRVECDQMSEISKFWVAPNFRLRERAREIKCRARAERKRAAKKRLEMTRGGAPQVGILWTWAGGRWTATGPGTGNTPSNAATAVTRSSGGQASFATGRTRATPGH